MAASGHNLQNVDDASDKDKAPLLVNSTKLKEFEHHAEMQAEPGRETETKFASYTPSPKLWTDDEVDAGLPNGTNHDIVLKPETLPMPVPVQLNPVSSSDDSVNDEEYKELANSKKSSSVGKKGVVYEGPSVVPKKEADPSTLVQSVTARKEADPKMKKPSVTPRKEADPSFQLESGPEEAASTTPSITTVSVNDNIIASTVTESPKVVVTGQDSGKIEKFKATDLNMLTPDREKTFPSKLSEANMDFKTNMPNLAVTSVPPTKSPSKSTLSMGSEPAKPFTADPVTKESFTTLRSKPTAATDTSGSATDSSDISYTPLAVGIVLLVAIVVTVIVVGYKRLQDVWMRRHYARMDFLIDGMYDM
ncbi:hypothetical protein SK128_002695 [Halocaridina rubra]|uniref:Uncharacterized protein n=1 Tax=Halocaridina rubra TaxID=373956 RepID=A0AAN9FUN8_HALRR